MPSKRKMEVSFGKPGNEDLRKFFHPTESFHVPTPAFDEICDEYFLSAKDNKNKNQKPEIFSCPGDNVSCLQPRISNETAQNPLPPSHPYFFHNDPRIRNLVRSRLPYFFPLGDGNNGDFKQPNASAVDYMSQFNSGEPSRNRGAQKVDLKKRSCGRVKSRASTAEEPSHVDNWVNPRSSRTVTKNAGKRRVHASGKSTGRWFTGADGRKVYVTGNGEELKGGAAYRKYRKDNSLGLKKSSKKPKGNRKVKR